MSISADKEAGFIVAWDSVIGGHEKAGIVTTDRMRAICRLFYGTGWHDRAIHEAEQSVECRSADRSR